MLKWIGWKVPATATTNFYFCTFFSRMKIIRFFPFFSLFLFDGEKKTFSKYFRIHIDSEDCLYANGNCMFPSFENRKSGGGKIGLEFHQFISHRCYSTLHSRALKAKSNIEIVLPANCLIAASCGLNSGWDCRPSRRTPNAPHSHRGIRFYYHINNICHRHRI